MIRARITGTGHFLPEKVLTNHDLEKLCDTSDEWIRKRTGIEERRMANPGDATSDLALPAARMAIEEAGLAPAEIDVIICCTVTPDYILPSTAGVIQAHLGAKKAAAFDLNAACSGFMYGLLTANSYIQSGMYKNALVIGAEITTQLITWKNRDTSVLFADGAGAAVLVAEEGERGILSSYLASDGADREMLIVYKGGSKEPLSPENINDDPLTITMKGTDLFKKAVTMFGEAGRIALEDTGLAVEDIDLFIPHQANTRIIEAATQRMGIPSERVFINMNKVGNTVAASIPLALSQARDQGRIKDGDILLLASFGAGLTWASSIIRW